MTTKRNRKSGAAAGLSRDKIVQAALAEMSERGRAALSMRTLASRLGCEAMSLYHHVEGIEGVLDGVVDQLLEPLAGSTPRSGDPYSHLRAFAQAYLRLAADQPNAFPLLATRLWRTPNAIAVAGMVVSLLEQLGLGGRAALRHARILGAYLNGAGLAIAAWQTGDSSGTAEAARYEPGLTAKTSSISARDVRADLEAGLERLLAAAAP